MSTLTVRPASSLQGELHVPGDKSVSHRALLLALVSSDPVHIHGLAPGADVASTRAAIEQLGAQVDPLDGDDSGADVVVRGTGLRFLNQDASVTINAGNSGTLARLLAGLLAGQPGQATIVGDESLSTRPMNRIAEPLRTMGAAIDLADGGTLPMVIRGSRQLAAGEFDIPIASAQGQGAVLLAALSADGDVTVRLPAAVRDHTVRMLRLAGLQVWQFDGTRAATVRPPTAGVQLPEMFIAGDPSAAAPFIAAATVLHESLLRLPCVLQTPGRTGFTDALERMGARIALSARGTVSGEPVADLEVTSSGISRVDIERDDVPGIVDELPLLALLAQFCKGETVISGAGELRLKESDRITATVRALRDIGIVAEELPDGLVVRGSGQRPEGGTIDAAGDHRLAMLAGIAGLVSRSGVEVVGAECVDVSFPDFFQVLESLAVR